MAHIAYGINLSKNEVEIIRQMIALVTDEPADVYDLRSYQPISTEGDILFLYGDRAIGDCGKLPHRVKLEFPDVSRLVAGFGDEEERELAHQKLLDFKAAIADTQDSAVERTVIPEESLPPISTSQALGHLKVALSHENVEAWEGVTKNGKKFRITLVPEESDADIRLTFVELYMIRAAMDTLQVEELEIVHKPNSNRESSTR
jgi:hypothetical protein